MTRRPQRLFAALTALLLLGSLAAVRPLAAQGHAVTNHTITSHDGTPIVVTVYKPATANPESPAPVILHSHGWAGSRTSGASAFSTELGRGFGVVSIDQRGHGQSGDKAHVQNPDLEGRDIIAVIDFVADLDWVAKDTDEDGEPIPDDPVLFAMGGSYGGIYQLVGALTEVRDSGRTRFNALAPEITWFNLAESLAPQKVTRTAWAALLYAVGAPIIADHVHPAFAYGSTTGQWPDGTVPVIANLEEEFFRNGPSGFVAAEHHLDIPVLIGQGATDNLFNLNQGWHNFEQTLTGEAREQSIFIGYNGGHVLPNVLPLGYGAGGDPCSQPFGGFSALRLQFFEAVLSGENPRDIVGHAYSLATVDGACVRLDSLDPTTTAQTGVDITVMSGTLTSTGVGAAQHHELASGPMTVAGIPKLSARVTTAGADQRVFFALSVGTSPTDARVVQNNMMPLRELLPVVQQDRTIELPGIAVELEEGENLYLTISPVSDMSFGHGSARTPGVVGLENITVHLPVLSTD